MKIRMFKCCVWSVLAYGNAAWKLDDNACKALRGWNARCLTRITDRGIREETIDPSANLVNYIRAQRLKWLGHTLRRERNHPAKGIRIQPEKDWSFKGGSVLMDAPVKNDMAVLAIVEFGKDERTRHPFTVLYMY